MDTDKSIPEQVYEAARLGKLKELPKEWLTQENLTWKDGAGMTALHRAAACGHLNQIPGHLLNQQNLTLKCCHGLTPFYYAAMGGHLDQVPAELLTQENLSMKDKYGYPLFCLGGRSCTTLKRIPVHLLTQENLTLKDNDGKTLFHWAAVWGELTDIPANLLTQENLTLKDNDGITPLQLASRSRSLDNLSASVLWSFQNEVIQGKPLLEHVSPQRRAELEAKAGKTRFHKQVVVEQKQTSAAEDIESHRRMPSEPVTLSGKQRFLLHYCRVAMCGELRNKMVTIWALVQTIQFSSKSRWFLNGVFEAQLAIGDLVSGFKHDFEWTPRQRNLWVNSGSGRRPSV